MRAKCRCAAALVLALFVGGEMRPSCAAAEPAEADWPRWRGPLGTGLAPSARLPATWPAAAPQPLWTTPTDDGWSSPVVADGRLFITDRLEDEERLTALDASTGTLVWRRTNPVDFDPHEVGRRHGNGPKSTPVVADGLVYSLGISGFLQCVQAADGKPVWHSFLPREFGAPVALPDHRAYVDGETNVIVPIAVGQGAPVPLFGYTGSPLVAGDRLICPAGGARGGTIMAFDRRNGEVLWKALRENVSYSSPVVAEIGGVPQVVVMTGPRTVGLELATGRLLWSFDYQIQYDESIGTPCVAGDLVLVTAVGRPLSAHRIAASDGRFTASPAWENHDLSSYLSSMVVVGEHVYGMNDGGEWHCLRLGDGRTVWRGGAHGYYCTPVVAGARLLGLNNRGELAVLALDPTAYRPEASQRLTKEDCWTSPAVVGDRIYVRSRNAVACFEIK